MLLAHYSAVMRYRRPLPHGMMRSVLLACAGRPATRTRLYRPVLTRIPFFVMVLGAAMLYVACGGTEPPDPVARITITSPIGEMMAVGYAVTLDAVATDTRGNTVTSPTYSWNSSNRGVATVHQFGRVTGVASGMATITASVDGVSGDLTMRVVVADLDGIAKLVADPFTVLLVAGLNTASEVSAGLETTRQALIEGNVLAAQRGLEVALSAINSVTDPDDRALSAVLRLLLDYAKSLLGL